MCLVENGASHSRIGRKPWISILSFRERAATIQLLSKLEAADDDR
jgi:hypothetical protein